MPSEKIEEGGIMLAKVESSTICGINAAEVEVEIDVAERGMPSFSIITPP